MFFHALVEMYTMNVVITVCGPNCYSRQRYGRRCLSLHAETPEVQLSSVQVQLASGNNASNRKHKQGLRTLTDGVTSGNTLTCIHRHKRHYCHKQVLTMRANCCFYLFMMGRNGKRFNTIFTVIRGMIINAAIK